MKDDKDRSSRLKFPDIYAQEKAEISKRRQKHFYNQKQDELPTDGFVGLALSGGGIRSATFNLGFLQELHELKILRIFDYLSTVSGGGYVGGWWSAWLSREEVFERAKEESPFFTAKDIKNVNGLITRLRDSDSTDEVSSALKEQMKERKTKRLLEMSYDADLVAGLVEELNIFLSKPPRAGAPVFNWPDSISIKPVRPLGAGAGTNEDQSSGLDVRTLWTNRIHLEHTYPCELRNIFPPKELIEPKRKYVKENGTGSEGSLCAWEDPIHHLRLFANYLTPRKGLLSADTWRAISVITRNLLLTWLILLPILTAVMLLGQVYYLFMSPDQFMAAEHISWVYALPPIGILLGLSVAMAIAWLLCNRDTTSSTDLIAQIVCFIALGALLVSAVWMIPLSPEQWEAIKNYQSLLAGIGAFTLLVILVMWYWKINRDDLAGKDNETILRWKREVRRGRFSKVQARLLVFTFIVAAVLFVSWLSCALFAKSPESVSSGADAESSFGWLPFIPALLSAVGGSIFTALRTAPSAGIDKPASHKPSAISRFIFAVTPGLVVLVLAVLAAWVAHALLHGALHMSLTPEGKDNLNLVLRAAGFLVITLALALAVYEMKDVKWSGLLKPAWSSLIFVACLMVTASWLWQAGVAQIPGIDRQHRVLASAILAFCIMIVIQRAIPREKWKSRLGIQPIETPKSNSKLANTLFVLRVPILGILVFTALTVIGWVIGEAIFMYTAKAQDDRILGALVLALAALPGGAILYRLLTVRRGKQRYVFEIRFFKNKNFSKRPELLWGLASLCLVLPLIGLCLAHELSPNKIELGRIKEPILFPVALAVLLISLITLRSLVLHRPKNAPPLVGWSGKLFDWVLGKIPKVNGRKEQAFRLLAFLALSVAMLSDIIAKNQFANAAISPVGEVMIRTEWIFLGIALMVNLPIFGVSVFKTPPREGFSSSLTFKETSLVYKRATLWTLAFICVALALLTGYLLTNWLEQLSKIELHIGLTPLLLPVAAQCLLMILFEVSWGRRENRRSLWLIGLAYFGIAVIFFMGLVAAREASIVSALLPEQISASQGSPATLDSIRIILGLFASVCVWIVSLGWMVDPNSVSMHQFYKARLVRAYLGASNIRRRSQGDREITDTVAGDDLLLKSLSNCDKGGPYHLINTTLNLVAGRDLATAQRSASSFILSQKYCGSGRTSYRPTEKYMQGQLSLGTAIAASGAAISPNMGSKKPTAALAMLMTLLNVRLGYWAPTPNQHGWSLSQPRLWPFYLIREFLSQTNDLSSYCYLTDGGHFDNTGLYPLIERGCRFVVLVDCGADPQPSCFQDVGEVIRRCRIDFGTEIDLKLDSLITEPGKVMDRCFVVGAIRFSREHLNMLREQNNYDKGTGSDSDDCQGIIVYVKPSVIEGVTADVRQYSLENNLFPQQTTANQWFDEAQFESYRRLGMDCANKAFYKVAKELGETPRLAMTNIDKLFDDLRKTFCEEARTHCEEH